MGRDEQDLLGKTCRAGLVGSTSAMAEFFSSPVVNLVLLAAVGAALVAGGIYLISRVRAGINSKVPPTNQWLTKFKDLHAQGELSDEEYRTIKAVLAERLEHELNSTDEPR